MNYDALPSKYLVGISRAIKQSENEQAVEIDYLVCDVNGKPIAGRPVKLTIHDAQSGVSLFEKSFVSAEALQKTRAIVPGLSPLNVIAEVTDDENHVHRANILSQTDIGIMANNAEKKASISIGLEGYNAASNFAEIVSPFSKSKSIFISNSSSNSTCKIIETNGKPVREDFQIAPLPHNTEVFAKLYDTNTPGNPEAAIGDWLAPGIEVPQMALSLGTTEQKHTCRVYCGDQTGGKEYGWKPRFECRLCAFRRRIRI